MNKVSIPTTCVPTYLILLLLLIPSLGRAQTTFLQVLNTTTASLTNDEQANLNTITQQSEVLSYWHISIDNIENALIGRHLQVSLPNEITTSFEADFPFSEGPGQYYWIGYNMDGSYFQLIKRQNEASGKVYIASSGNYYGFISLSSTKTILVKYDNTIAPQVSECGDLISDEDDDSVEDRGGCEINNIRVLFLFTPAVAGFLPSPSSVAVNAIAELNHTSMASGMAETDVHFESAGTSLLPGFIETPNMKDDVDALCSNSTAQSLRDSRHADIVVLLMNSTHGGVHGQVKAVGASNSRAYAGVEIRWANSGPRAYTAAHEVGHILGARHQRCTTCAVGQCDELANHHGFMVGATMRTMMAQHDCPTSSRIERWSNPAEPFIDLSTGSILLTGDPQNDNAKKIKSRASKVCCFRDAPPETGNSTYTFLASINGPSEICNVQGYYPYQHTITASPEIVYPLTYVWEISYIGVGNYAQVSTSSSWVLTDPSTLPGYWTTVRLTVTDAANHTAQGFYEIHRNDCPGFSGGGGDRSSSLSSIPQLNDSSITATPNPASDRLTITGLGDDSQINVFDLNGRICKSVSADKPENGEIQVSLDNMNAGIYFISIKIVGQPSPIKIRFVKL